MVDDFHYLSLNTYSPSLVVVVAVITLRLHYALRKQYTQ